MVPETLAWKIFLLGVVLGFMLATGPEETIFSGHEHHGSFINPNRRMRSFNQTGENHDER